MRILNITSEIVNSKYANAHLLLVEPSLITLSSLRRKSALPKYEPPYIKRPIAGPGPGGPAAKGYSHPNSPHPSQAHMTPDHAYPDNDNGGKMMSYAPTPTYRSVE